MVSAIFSINSSGCVVVTVIESSKRVSKYWFLECRNEFVMLMSMA